MGHIDMEMRCDHVMQILLHFYFDLKSCSLLNTAKGPIDLVPMQPSEEGGRECPNVFIEHMRSNNDVVLRVRLEGGAIMFQNLRTVNGSQFLAFEMKTSYLLELLTIIATFDKSSMHNKRLS